MEPWTLSEMIWSRRSCRTFSSDSVPDDLIQRIVFDCQSAPSAGNLQAYEVVAVRSDEGKMELSGCAFNQVCVSEAAVVLVFIARPLLSQRKYRSRGHFYSVQDATIACSYAQLLAHSHGLVSVWVGAFHEGTVKNALGIDVSSGSEDFVPVSLLCVGWPTTEAPKKKNPRRLTEDVLHWERF
jgi:nitroreductase